MSFRLGLVGLCTSHPANWVPIIRQLHQEGLADAEVVAAWDGGETRPEGFAREFCRDHDIPNAVSALEEMPALVDGVIIHSANWDRHIEQARPFVEAGKPVLIDKPVVGNLRDVNQLLDWAQQGRRITGGSSLRFAPEVQEFLSRPADERGEVHTAFAGCGSDEYSYGIHAYSLLCAMMGPGIRSVRYLGAAKQRLLKVTWRDSKVGLLCIGQSGWLPFHVSAVTTKSVVQIVADTKRVYRALLEACLPYLTGKVEEPPLKVAALLEPELAALAARESWLGGGGEVFLTDLRLDDPGYDGHEYALHYRRGRLGGK